MPAKNQFTFNLPDEYAKLLRKAIGKYEKTGIKQTELIRRIISNWLFSNRLQIEDKNEKSRRNKKE